MKPTYTAMAHKTKAKEENCAPKEEGEAINNRIMSTIWMIAVNKMMRMFMMNKQF